MDESVWHRRYGVRIAVAVVVAMIVLILLGAAVSSVYHLKEGETAVFIAGGEIVGEPVTEPGWHFKRPDYAVRILSDDRFDRRGATEGRRFWEGDPIATITSDRQRIQVETTAYWSVADPVRFRETFRDSRTAERYLDSIVDSAVRNRIATFSVAELLVENEHIESLRIGLEEILGDANLEFGSDFRLVFMDEQLAGIADSRTDGRPGNIHMAIGGSIRETIRIDEWGDDRSAPVWLTAGEHVAGAVLEDAVSTIESMDVGIAIEEVTLSIRVPRPVTVVIEE